MKKLLMTTAMLTALAAGAVAQDDPLFEVPEGYTAYEDVGRLTFDDLNGATIYDALGESIGEVTDVVFAEASSDMTDSAITTEAPVVDEAADMAAETDPATDDATDDAVDPAPEGDAGADMETEGDEVAPVEPTVPADDSDAGSVEPMAPADGTDVAPDDGVVPADDSNAGSVEPMAPADGTEVAPDDGMAEEPEPVIDDTAVVPEEPAGDLVDDVTEVSHVVIDIGGFLGMGIHTVAVPLEALEIYADGDNNLQIYLPWTEEQLRDLPEYDAEDPSTLGTMPAASE